MSNLPENTAQTGSLAHDTVLGIVWDQWAAVGSMASSNSVVARGRIVDPEALVLASIALQDQERRLTEVLQWWASDGTPLLSLHRMKRMAALFGTHGHEWFSEYAYMAKLHGHRSWVSHARKSLVAEPEEHRKSGGQLDLKRAGSLMLRLRAAFGVGAKADILCYLISTPSAVSTVTDISDRLAYTTQAIRDSLKDLSLTGLVSEADGRPATYATNQAAWLELFRPASNAWTSPPAWVCWSSILPFLVSATTLSNQAGSSDSNIHRVTSAARDLVERHENAFRFHRIGVPDLDAYRGLEFSTAFSHMILNLSHWLRRDAS